MQRNCTALIWLSLHLPFGFSLLPPAPNVGPGPWYQIEVPAADEYAGPQS